jgi:hypothetical protein
MASPTEKRDIEEIEHVPDAHLASSIVGENGFATESEELRKGYFYSPFFLGTTCAIGLNLMVHTPRTFFLGLQTDLYI